MNSNYRYYQVPLYMRTSCSSDPKLELDESKGEVICPECEGYGQICKEDSFMILRCPKCQGKKKLDWVERITGVAPPEEKIYTCGSQYRFAATCNSGIISTSCQMS